MKHFHHVFVAAALLLPASLIAQEPPARRGMGPGMRMGEPQNPVSILLEQREALALGEEQVEKLTLIQQKLQEQNQPLSEKLQAIRPRMEGGTRPRDMSADERAQMRARMEEARSLMQQVRTNHRKSLEEATVLLTPDQKEKAHELLEARREQMRERAGRRPGELRDRGARRPGRGAPRPN